MFQTHLGDNIKFVHHMIMRTISLQRNIFFNQNFKKGH